MYQLLLMIHVVIAITLIVMILLQQGKGASIGASFGSGASQTVFGSAGSATFLIKFTGGLAAGFFATSLILGYIAATEAKAVKQFSLPVPVQQAPASQPQPGSTSTQEGK